MFNQAIAQYLSTFQGSLFPNYNNNQEVRTDKHYEVMLALDVIDLNKFFFYDSCNRVGRPQKDRCAIAKSFVAKTVLNLPTTVALHDRLKSDITLRRICGFETSCKVPCLATLSNAFAEFSKANLLTYVHETMIKELYKETIVIDLSRDATAIPAREKPAKKEKLKGVFKEEIVPRKQGRPRLGEIVPEKEKSRIEKQMTMSLGEMTKELPKNCDYGTKKNSNGNKETWKGYKLHLDADNGSIPLNFIVTSASVHDSQVAIPLELSTNQRLNSCYRLMDAAYASEFIKEYIEAQGKVAIIDPKKPKGGEKIPLDPAKKIRYKIRTTVERTNAALKDDFGAKYLRVRGYEKVVTHLGFGIIAMVALRSIKLIF